MDTALIIDDDAAIRSMLRAVLSREGFAVVEAPDGAEALKILAKRHFDVIILDLMMPFTSGSVVLDHLAALPDSRRNVLVLTAANPRLFSKLNHGCIHSIQRKPFDLDEMRAAVHAAARRDVLVVEDNPAHQYLIDRELTRAGYLVTLATDGRKALQRLRERDFDAVVLDIALPEVSGYDVMNALRSGRAATPVVVLTILERLEREVAADAVLRKHNGLYDLLPTLRTVLAPKVA